MGFLLMLWESCCGASFGSPGSAGFRTCTEVSFLRLFPPLFMAFINALSTFLAAFVAAFDPSFSSCTSTSFISRPSFNSFVFPSSCSKIRGLELPSNFLNRLDSFRCCLERLSSVASPMAGVGLSFTLRFFFFLPLVDVT